MFKELNVFPLMLPKWSNLAVIAILCLVFVFANVVNAAEKFKLDTMVEDIPRKALIIKHDAKLFNHPIENTGKEAPFMQLYFLMTPDKNFLSKFYGLIFSEKDYDRVPVLNNFDKDKKQPDGWLEKDAFVEWNTVQMIDFTPQKNRQLVKIHNTKSCAQSFGMTGQTVGECQELGEEPQISSKRQYKFLVPLFQREQEIYHGGFVRVYQEAQQITPTSRLGYDLILVVDSTLSMKKFFPTTMQVLQAFVKHVQNSMIGEVAIPLRIGLLFYRDRRGQDGCDLEYMTKWTQNLTYDVDKVIQALNDAEFTSCNSDNVNEAVWDALNRAIVDTHWDKNHLKTIILIGDAPPYPESHIDGNPMQFSVTSVSEMASKKDIRFLTFKIGLSDTKEFKKIALATEEHRKGAFNSIAKDKISKFTKRLKKTLFKEWALVMRTQSHPDNTRNSEPQTPLDLSAYEYPIITYQRQRMEQSQFGSDFVKGWVPKRIKGQLAFEEYLFMKKYDLKLRINILDNIVTAVEAGYSDGSDAFLDAVRRALAAHFGMHSDQIFTRNETLDKILVKTNILPFKTEILSFTSAEVQSFKDADYKERMAYLTDKVDSLRAFSNDPNNQHYFGEVSYLYVPRRFFP